MVGSHGRSAPCLPTSSGRSSNPSFRALSSRRLGSNTAAAEVLAMAVGAPPGQADANVSGGSAFSWISSFCQRLRAWTCWSGWRVSARDACGWFGAHPSRRRPTMTSQSHQRQWHARLFDQLRWLPRISGLRSSRHPRRYGSFLDCATMAQQRFQMVFVEALHVGCSNPHGRGSSWHGSAAVMLKFVVFGWLRRVETSSTTTRCDGDLLPPTEAAAVLQLPQQQSRLHQRGGPPADPAELLPYLGLGRGKTQTPQKKREKRKRRETKRRRKKNKNKRIGPRPG